MNNNVFFKNTHSDKFNPDISDKYNKLQSNRRITLAVVPNQKPYKPIIYDNQPINIKTVEDLKIPIEKGDTKVLMNSYQASLDVRLLEKKKIESNIKQNPVNKINVTEVEKIKNTNQYNQLKDDFKKFSTVSTNSIIDKDKLNTLLNELDTLLQK